MRKFLGAIFDEKTMTYRYSDGSGVPYPEEMRIEVLSHADGLTGSALNALVTKWEWQDRLKKSMT